MLEEMVNVLLPHLKKEEGWRESCYRDHLGYLTIGYGRLIDEKKGGHITRDEGEYLLLNDIQRIETALMVAIPWMKELNGVRQAILVSMAYQMGVDGLLGFRNMLKHCKNGQFAAAGTHMRASRWAKQTPERAFRMSQAMEMGTAEELL